MTDPYAGNIEAKHSYFIEWKEVGHIPREISRYVYFLLKKKMVKFLVKSLKNKVPPILFFSFNDIFMQGEMGNQYCNGRIRRILLQF